MIGGAGFAMMAWREAQRRTVGRYYDGVRPWVRNAAIRGTASHEYYGILDRASEGAAIARSWRPNLCVSIYL